MKSGVLILSFLVAAVSQAHSAVLLDRYSLSERKYAFCGLMGCTDDDISYTKNEFFGAGAFLQGQLSDADNSGLSFFTDKDEGQLSGEFSYSWSRSSLTARYQVSEGEAYNFDFSSSIASSWMFEYPAGYRISFKNVSTNKTVFEYLNPWGGTTSVADSLEGILAAGEYVFYIETYASSSVIEFTKDFIMEANLSLAAPEVPVPAAVWLMGSGFFISEDLPL
jgi:hypothetical protein